MINEAWDWTSLPWIVCCCKDGTLTVRERGRPSFNDAALPVWGAETRERAEELVRTCGAVAKDASGQREHPELPGRPWYRIDVYGPELDIEHLGLVTERFALADALTGKREGGP